MFRFVPSAVFGCGVIVNYLQLYYSEPKPGPVTATRLLARLVSSAIGGTSLVRGVFRRVVADIDCDEERLPYRTFTVVLGGTIPAVDVTTLLDMGVTAVYPAGTDLRDVVSGILAAAGSRERVES
jgi:methylmalonyl-CoA mutase cobalamin-binding domain/chain